MSGIIAYFGRSVSTHMLKCVATKKIALGKIAASCMEIRFWRGTIFRPQTYNPTRTFPHSRNKCGDNAKDKKEEK